MEGGLFNFRVAGVAILNSKILLHKTGEDNYWSLPGGRVELFEHSRETLLREIIEETGRSVRIGNLCWVVENFFGYNQQKYHEIGFYYRMEFDEPYDQHDFYLREAGKEFVFRWHELSLLDDLMIYPHFITRKVIERSDFLQHFTLPFHDLSERPDEHPSL